MISGQLKEIDAMWGILRNIFSAIEKLSLDQFRLVAGLAGFAMCIASIVSIFAIPISPYAVEIFPLFRVFVCMLVFGSGSAILWYSLSTQRKKRIRIARYSFRSIPIVCVFYSAFFVLKDVQKSLTSGHIVASVVIAILLSIPVFIVVEKLLRIAIKLNTAQKSQT